MNERRDEDWEAKSASLSDALARIAVLEKAVDRLLVAAGLRPDPALVALAEARDRPKRSFEDLCMERMVATHPSTRQMTEAMARAVPDGLVATIAADRRGTF